MTTSDKSTPPSSLEAEYNLRARHPEHQSVRAGWAAASARAKARLDWRQDVRYGAAPRQRLDLFPAPEAASPLLVFIHGGYWRSNDKSNYAFIAAPVIARGGALAIINYGLAPDTAMGDIIEHAREAVTWLYDNEAAGQFDRTRIHIAGHSAGGHLAAELLATDWQARGLPAEVIRGVTAISGLFDLAPLIETSINNELGLDQKSARQFSPLYRMPRLRASLAVAVGADETDAFLQQSRDYAERCRAAGHDCNLLCLEACNHYTILSQLADSEAPLTQAVLAQMGLG
ncbi:MAG: alpha/beta hydrolase [Alphaproteobacteria bacterium]